jgi:hypothetical protein
MPLQLCAGKLILGSNDSKITMIASEFEGLKIMSGSVVLMELAGTIHASPSVEYDLSFRQNGATTQYKTKHGVKLTSIKLFFQESFTHYAGLNIDLLFAGWSFTPNPSENSVLLYTIATNAIESSDWTDLYVQKSENTLIHANNGSNELAQAFADEKIFVI